jgi:curved DNA-binding protein CbpA
LNLVLKFHPEKNPDDPFAKERFEAINAAYEEIGKVLSK